MKKFLLIFFCIISIAVGVSGESFDNYKKEYSKENFYDKGNQEFEEYKERVHKGFQIYKDTLIKEFKKYKDEINKYWQTAETSNQKNRTLRRNLPYEETKKYIKRVVEKISYYNSF